MGGYILSATPMDMGVKLYMDMSPKMYAKLHEVKKMLYCNEIGILMYVLNVCIC
jgi:hypothetical protein